MDRSRPFRLYCVARKDSFTATIEREKLGGMVCPITFPIRVTLSNERNWTIPGLEAPTIVRAIKRLRVQVSSIPFRIYTDHNALGHFVKVGEHHPRVQ